MTNADKMEAHKTLVTDAIEAIQAVHSDTEVSLEVTLESLSELSGEVSSLIDAVKEDIASQESEG